MWHSLVWKEWREQRWRLWFGVALLATFTVIGLRTRIIPDESIIAMTVLIGGLFLPLMVAMGLVAPERADGTIVRLLALPVPAWHVLAVKAVVGTAVCVAPIIASALLALLMAKDRELSWGDMTFMYAMATGMSVAMFAWFTAAGVRQPSEARAGLVGVGVAAGWALAIAISSMLGIEMFNDATRAAWVGAFSPFGLLMLRGGDAPPAAMITIQISMFAAVWSWAAWRIGKPGKGVA